MIQKEKINKSPCRKICRTSFNPFASGIHTWSDKLEWKSSNVTTLKNVWKAIVKPCKNNNSQSNVTQTGAFLLRYLYMYQTMYNCPPIGWTGHGWFPIGTIDRNMNWVLIGVSLICRFVVLSFTYVWVRICCSKLRFCLSEISAHCFRWEEVQVPCVRVQFLHEGKSQGPHAPPHGRQAVQMSALRSALPNVRPSKEPHRVPHQTRPAQEAQNSTNAFFRIRCSSTNQSPQCKWCAGTCDQSGAATDGCRG